MTGSRSVRLLSRVNCRYTAHMKVKTWAIAYGLAVCLFTQPAVAGQFENATAAYERGDYATALQLLQPLAEQGDATAQYNLGIMYATRDVCRQSYQLVVPQWVSCRQFGKTGFLQLRAISGHSAISLVSLPIAIYLAGKMFWFSRNRFVGSYFVFSSTKRS